MSALLRQTSRRIQALLPILSSVTLVLIGLAPVGLPHFDNVAPAFALMAVFYWSIFRSDLMTMLGAFMIGLLLDLRERAVAVALLEQRGVAFQQLRGRLEPGGRRDGRRIGGRHVKSPGGVCRGGRRFRSTDRPVRATGRPRP